MDNLYWLDQVQPNHRPLVGNKAFHLSRVLQKGYPVVPGFVVSARAFRVFLESVDWSEPLFSDLPNSSLRVDIENSRQLQAIAQQIRQRIEIPSLATDLFADLTDAIAQFQAPLLVLRPSLILYAESVAIGASRGNEVVFKSSSLFDMQVCRANAADVAIGLKQLWGQVFSAKSLFYWQRSQVPLQQINLAVLVQPLQPAIAAGTVRVHGSQFEVQSTLGLGMAIARGEVVPELYQIDTQSGTIQSYQAGRKTIAYEALVEPLVEKSVLVTQLPQLQPRLLSEEEQHFTLADAWLRELIQLVQNLTVDLGTSLELEWLFCQQGELTPQLQLTQVIPRLPVIAHRANSSRLESPMQPGRLLLDEQWLNSLPDHALVLTGLAASPGRAIAKATIITQANPPPAEIPPGTVLIAANIPADWLPLIRQAAAIVSEQGGMTSHSAILARELGVPAVMATGNATRQIQPGELVMVDGRQGKVYRITERETDIPFKVAAESPRETIFSPTEYPSLRTQLMVNLSQPDTLARVSALPVDGIGLLRSELLALSVLNSRHPHHWLQTGQGAELAMRLAEQIKRFAEAMLPRPVFFRGLDLRTHEFSGLVGSEAEATEVNPMLGIRGTFRYLINPALLDVQLAAIAQVQQAGYPNIRLLLPFVRTVEEFRFCRQRVQQAGLLSNPQFQIWIMAEVPSVLFLLPEYVRAGVQGISIGTNDLTQLLLGIDRDQGQMATMLDERHPAVMAAIAQLIAQAKQLSIPCCLCGQAPVHYPELIEKLVQWGITAISVEPEAVQATYQAIARAEL